MMQEISAILETGSLVMIFILGMYVVLDLISDLKESENTKTEIIITLLIVLFVFVIMFVLGAIVEFIMAVIL
jgi:hypothetical protein